MSKLIADTSFIDLPLLSKGKVREMYDLGDSILMVVTDRVSAFDIVFDELVPDKGRVLNSISTFWFEKLKDIVPNHVLSVDPADYPNGLDRFREELEGRSMLVKKAEMLPAECIVRGYLDGSALKEYQATGIVGGHRLPEGLRQGDRLPEAIFTPSTKAEEGHDINITIAELEELLGSDRAKQLEQASLALYRAAAAYAEERGIIIADSKFEFGLINGELTICDELFTPDSSRFWEKSEYAPGAPQKSLDKQYLRDYLETLDWNKEYPAPPIPEVIIEATADRYRDAYKRLTGNDLYQ